MKNIHPLDSLTAFGRSVVRAGVLTCFALWVSGAIPVHGTQEPARAPAASPLVDVSRAAPLERPREQGSGPSREQSARPSTPSGDRRAPASPGTAESADVVEPEPPPLERAPASEGRAAPEDTREIDGSWTNRQPLVHVNTHAARVRIGGDLVLDEQERVEHAVTLFGDATVNGQVAGNLVVVGGDVRLGPRAVVRGNVVAIGGAVEETPGAIVGGRVSEVRFSSSDFRIWVPDEGEVSVEFQPDWPRIARVVFMSGLMGGLFWFVVFAVLISIAPGAVERTRAQAGASPLLSLVTGAAAILLFLPVLTLVTAVLSISVIGLPLVVLIPFVVLAFGLTMAIGYTAVAYAVGANLTGNRVSRVAALTLGLVLVWGTGMTGRYLWMTSQGAFGWGVMLLAAGVVIELVVCTTGLGAALLAWSSSRRDRRAAAVASGAGPSRGGVPPIPPVPSANPPAAGATDDGVPLGV